MNAYTHDDRNVIRREFIVMNILRLRILLPLISMTELVNILYNIFNGESTSPLIIISYSIVMLISGVLAILYAMLKINDIPTLKLMRINYLVLLLNLLAVLFVTYCEIKTGEIIVSPYLFIMALGIIPLLSFAEMMITTGAFIIGNALLIPLYDGRVLNMQTLIFLSLISMFISLIQYSITLNIISEYVLLTNKTQKLIEISERDPLTGVYNRRGFINIVQKYSNTGAQYAILMVDIDDFKKYNDQYYHDSGDICLQKISAALTRSVFRREDLVVRYGGEEFVVYLFGLEKRDVLSVAERIQNEIALLKIDFGGRQYVTVSIGAAHSPEGSKRTVQEVIIDADKELYNAKRSGKNCISFCSEIFRPNPAKISQNANEDVMKMLKDQTMHHSKKTVLIIDNLLDNREQLAALLSPDYAVATADNSLDALRLLTNRSNVISAVMLDIAMPDMEGPAFINRIRSYDDLKNMPLIVINGNNGKEYERRALMYGAWDFVSKPYDASIIKFRLKNAIDRSQLPAFNQLKYLAEYDELTGIYNKNRFFDATHEILGIGNSDNYVFIRFDIVRFQLVNSFFGMEEGDKLLKYLAHSISAYGKYLQEYSYGRIEADTFAVCLPYESDSSVREFVDYIRDELRRYPIDFDIVPVFGVFVVTNRSMPVNSMLDKANLAAKGIKGDYVSGVAYYTEDMGRQLETEQELTNEMNEAIETRQFVVYIQPKYRLDNREPCGGEALVRWQHPERGLIPPGVFIPVFERNGFIVKLDYYVWELVCSKLGRWIAEGYNPQPISVNLSRVNLYNNDLVDTLSELTARYGVPNRLLNLEITENVYTNNPDIMRDMISKLRARGFIVLMDDFGSGYSSLNMLKDIEIDMLKIDVKFLSNTTNSARSRSIISSVISMAKRISIGTIVEGVENVEQTEFLSSVGCDYAQGFYFARPMPCDDYERRFLFNRYCTERIEPDVPVDIT